MSKKWTLVLFGSTLVLGFTLYLGKKAKSKKEDKDSSFPATAEDKSAEKHKSTLSPQSLTAKALEADRDRASPSPSKVEEDAQAYPSEPVRRVETIASQDELLKAIYEANLFSTQDLTHVVERLKSSNGKEMADALHRGMIEAGPEKLNERNRITLVADSWRSPELLPLWKDLALRESLKEAGPLVRMDVAEPNAEIRGIELEMLTAIGNLGVLGAESAEARAVLTKIITEPEPGVHTLFLRERAYFSLKEADVTASIVVLRNLPSEDPLRQSIQRPH